MNAQGINSRQAPDYSPSAKAPPRSPDQIGQKNVPASQAASAAPAKAGRQDAASAQAPARTPEKNDARPPSAAMPTAAGKFANSISNNAQSISFRKPAEKSPAAQNPTQSPDQTVGQNTANTPATSHTSDKTDSRPQGARTATAANPALNSAPDALAPGRGAKIDMPTTQGVKRSELPAASQQTTNDAGRAVDAVNQRDVMPVSNATSTAPAYTRGSGETKGNDSYQIHLAADQKVNAEPLSVSPADASADAPANIPALPGTASQETTDQELSAAEVGITDAGVAEINQNFIASGEAVGRGFNGEGITVGVVSDSFDDPEGIGSYAEDVASGDLPADVRILREGESITTASGGNEGRAMAQVIHDIAPGADLVFHSAFNNGGGQIGQSNAAAIDNLVADGADIIVDDTNSFTAPVYQRGPHAQAIDRAADAGVPVFSSSGSGFNNAIERTGDLAVNQPDQANSPLVEYQPGETALVTLHWDDPYSTISDEGNVPTADFSLAFVQVTENGDFLLDENGAVQPVALGLPNEENPQLTITDADQNQTENSADPVEILAFRNNTGEVMTGRWVALLVEGDGENRTTRMTFHLGQIPEDVDRSSLFGAGLAENGIQVSAVNLNNSQVESFYSPQPGRLLFDDQGNRLENGGQLVAVDLAAPDGANTTHFGRDVLNDPDEFPNFFGTSAAAPYAAAAAAIVLDYAGDSVAVLDRPEFIFDILTQTTQNLDSEAQTGVGIVNVQSAISAVPSSPWIQQA